MDAAAALGFKIDSSDVVKAANDLDRFAQASDRAAASGGKVNLGGSAGSIAKLVAEVQSANSKLTAIVGTLEKIASVDRAAAAANDNLSRSFGVADAHVTTYRQHLEALATSQATATAVGRAADAHVVAYSQHLAGLASQHQQLNAHVLAYQASMQAVSPIIGQADAHVIAYRSSLKGVEEGAVNASKAIKFTAQDSLNATRQLADIGVTAAMGMSPFMIAIQQGPQLLDILQNKAAVTGQSLGAVFRAAALSIGAALAPFLPLIAAVAALAAGFVALNAQADKNNGLKKYTTEMGYTKAEVKKLNAVTVEFGDTMKAVWDAALNSAAEALGINTKNMSKTWDSFLDRLISGTRATMAGVYALFAGTKAYLGEVEKGGVLGIGKMLIGQGDPKLIEKTYGKAYQDSQKFMDGIVAQSRVNARARQDKMAKEFYDPKKEPKGPKSDAEKFSDIVRRAQAEVEAERTRAAAVGLSAQAATEAEQRTKLLNQVEQAKIPITAAVRAKVDELAKSYAALKTAADVKGAVEGVSDSLKKQSDAINDQLSYVGLYGDELIRARTEMEALARARDALPKGEVLSSEQYARIVADAKKVSGDQINLGAVSRAKQMEKDAQDARYAMDLERAGLGLTGAAALSYSYVIDQLNQRKREGIALAPGELAHIQALGEAYGRQRYAIDQQAQAIADTREVAKGFFSDWTNGAREGANVFKSFADSAINALNRVIDKLLDRTLNNFLDGMFAGVLPKYASPFAGAGDISNLTANALGGVYGSPTRFANGGTFTNTIVNTPTLFRFANGGKMGEMGEAGPEAIMPLKRGPNGALGVQMHGGGRPAVRMGDINNTFQVTGAFDRDQVIGLIQQGGAATYDQVKRDLQSLLEQLNNDEAFAS